MQQFWVGAWQLTHSYLSSISAHSHHTEARSSTCLYSTWTALLSISLACGQSIMHKSNFTHVLVSQFSCHTQCKLLPVVNQSCTYPVSSSRLHPNCTAILSVSFTCGQSITHTSSFPTVLPDSLSALPVSNQSYTYSVSCTCTSLFRISLTCNQAPACPYHWLCLCVIC